MGIARSAILALAALVAVLSVPGLASADQTTAVEPTVLPAGAEGRTPVTLTGEYAIAGFNGNPVDQIDPFVRVIGVPEALFFSVSILESRAGSDPAAPRVATKIQVLIDEQYLATPGTLMLRTYECLRDDVRPGNCGGASPIIEIPIVAANPAPVLSSVSPLSVSPGQPVTLTVTGSGLNATTVFQLNGETIEATITPTGATIALAADAIPAAGNILISATNPGPGGGTSASLGVQVDRGGGAAAGPVVLAVFPAQALAGESLLLVGSGFGSSQESRQIWVGGKPAGEAALWRDGRVQVEIPDGIDVGTQPIEIDLGDGGRILIGLVVVAPPLAVPPVANPALLSGSGATVTFDASAAIDAATGAGVLTGVNANNAALSGIASILWKYGDGAASTEPSPTYTYTRPGTYRPRVTVTSVSGASTTISAGSVRVSRGSGGGLRAALPPVNFRVPSRVVFDAGSAKIRPEARPYLLRLASLVNRIGRRTEIGGHTDSTGPAGYNMDLSKRRAREVRGFLVGQGKVPPGLLSAAGYGDTRPLVPNDDALGRQRNRRVELSIKRGATPIRLTRRQLLINQRLSRAALARESAIRARLSRGLTADDIRDGSIDAQNLAPDLVVRGIPQAVLSRPMRRQITVPSIKKGSGKIRRTAGQLATNQRISQAAIRRVAALESLLERGLTGALVRDASLPSDKLAAGLRMTTTSPPAAAIPLSITPPTAAVARGGKVRLTQEQLIINQRISQAALRRLNALRSRLESGLTGADFRDGSLTAADFDL